MLHNIQQNSYQYGCRSFKKDTPKMVPIAPAPGKKFSSLDLQADKRKYNTTSNPYTGAQAASIARRNARERNRVKQVNDGFSALRKRLPAAVVTALSGGSRRGSGNKLSKVDTLRMVVEYIRHLEGLIDDSDAALGHRTALAVESSHEGDEGVFGSPYSDEVPSPAASECSSEVSSGFSNSSCYPNCQVSEQLSPMDEDDLLDAISWWQQK